MNKHAQALARLGRGIPKKYSKEELERRSMQLKEARKKRWIVKRDGIRND